MQSGESGHGTPPQASNEVPPRPPECQFAAESPWLQGASHYPPLSPGASEPPATRTVGEIARSAAAAGAAAGAAATKAGVDAAQAGAGAARTAWQSDRARQARARAGEHASRASSVVGQHVGRAGQVVTEHVGRARPVVTEQAGRAGQVVSEQTSRAGQAVSEQLGRAREHSTRAAGQAAQRWQDNRDRQLFDSATGVPIKPRLRGVIYALQAASLLCIALQVLYLVRTLILETRAVAGIVSLVDVVGEGRPAQVLDTVHLVLVVVAVGLLVVCVVGHAALTAGVARGSAFTPRLVVVLAVIATVAAVVGAPMVLNWLFVVVIAVLVWSPPLAGHRRAVRLQRERRANPQVS